MRTGYMNKLELKHLAPYLPYELKVKTAHGFDTMTTLNEFIINGDHEQSYSYEEEPECLPILRPLSDLTKPIQHKGDEFVPMQRLLKMVYDVDNDSIYKESDYIVTDIEGTYYCYPHGGSYYWISFDGFDFDHQETESKLPLQREAWETLYEWRFDIHGLIEKGLAVDVNTLETNPYK